MISEASSIATIPVGGDAVATKFVILVVEDGAGEREALARLLRLQGYEVQTARDVDRAEQLLAQPIDLVISDLRMGGRTGVDLLRIWQERHPQTPFIIVTAYGEVESAVDAMKLGARDYLTKPIDPERMLDLVRRCLAERKADGEKHAGGGSQVGVGRLLGDSPAMQRVRDQILRAASTDSTVLILGESGTGKELVAEAVHSHSNRGRRPLVTVNMAAIPETLVESELFGHVKGAFTGASSDRVGRFEEADHGTLFIDEIGDFPQAGQAKLLRVLETRVVRRIGAETERSIDVRLIAATSRSLREMIEERRFREDLYYRLNVITIELPPLRERREDIPQLVDHFVESIAETLKRPAPSIDPVVFGALCGHHWPGNIRELRNCLESMIVMAQRDKLTQADLPAGLSAAIGDDVGQGSAEEELRLDSLEKSVILQTLKKCDGNRTRAAEALGISVRTLQRRLKVWGVTN